MQYNTKGWEAKIVQGKAQRNISLRAMLNAIIPVLYLLCSFNCIIVWYHTAQNFGGRKLWWIWNCKKIGGENFGSWSH